MVRQSAFADSWAVRYFAALIANIGAMLAQQIVAVAGPIGLDAFTTAARVEDFEGLGPQTSTFASPLVIGFDLYHADGSMLTSGEKLGIAIGRVGVAIGNDPESSGESPRFVEVVLARPALRAGMYVGFEFPWEAKVQFYDLDDTLIGSIPLAGIGRDNSFAAWQADDGRISRILVVDMLNGQMNRLIVDDFIQEIAEPEMIMVFCIGLLPFVLFSRWSWKAQSS